MAVGDRIYRFIRPHLAKVDPETVRKFAIGALKFRLVNFPAVQDDPRLAVDLAGLHFANPIGAAAGFDKGGELVDQTLRGFGFTEVGTVTPRPQPGNSGPRLFYLPEDRAVINRFGFNSEGHAAVRSRLERRRARGGIVGVNVGANSDSEDRIADYVQGLAAFYELASYVAINVSSPNTPGLRGLQAGKELKVLVSRLNEERSRHRSRVPLFIKIAPDLGESQLQEIGDTAISYGIDALIVSNTTVTRPRLQSPLGSQTGGLSGRPIFDLATRTLARLYCLTSGRIPLIGVGGVDSAERAWQKLEAGASLLQLYTALVFEGPDLPARIHDGLSQMLTSSDYASIADVVGTAAHKWAEASYRAA